MGNDNKTRSNWDSCLKEVLNKKLSLHCTVTLLLVSLSCPCKLKQQLTVFKIRPSKGTGHYPEFHGTVPWPASAHWVLQKASTPMCSPFRCVFSLPPLMFLNFLCPRFSQRIRNSCHFPDQNTFVSMTKIKVISDTTAVWTNWGTNTNEVPLKVKKSAFEDWHLYRIQSTFSLAGI